MKHSSTATLSLLAAAALLTACSKSRNETVLSLAGETLPATVTALGGTAELVETSDGTKAVKIGFDSTVAYSGIQFTANTPLDYSGAKNAAFLFDVSNPGEFSVHLSANVRDGNGKSASRNISVPSGFDGTLLFELASSSLAEDDGMRGGPPAFVTDALNFVWMWGSKDIDLGQITQIRLTSGSLARDKVLLLKDIRFAENLSYDQQRDIGILDEFGQNAKAEYPSKIHSEEELRQIANEELAQLAASSGMPDRSKFGGWKDGPKLEATGYFRTQKRNGKWSLVDPEGYLYFATGIANSRMANTTTITGIDFKDPSIREIDTSDVTPEDSRGIVPVSDEVRATRFVLSKTRHDMFNWLPAYDHPLANHYSYRRSTHKGPVPHGETYSFYQANLERRYGETSEQSYLKKWNQVTVDRMVDWGFTSMGNWTDASFYQNNKIPYFANGWIIGDFKTVSSGNDAWSPMPDVYDPLFKERAEATVAVIADEVQGNPWCVGVFIDNEKSWGREGSNKSLYGIVVNTMGRDANESPCKAVFVQTLQAKYDTIKALNKSWGSNIASWDSLEKGFTTDEYTDGMFADFSILLKDYAATYFSIVDAALNDAMPNHMYMGVRFAHWGMTSEVLEAASEYVDVVSYNCYKESIHESYWDFLEKVDMPSIIGEFHIGATDTGIFHPGLIAAANQADRAKMYQDYMRSVIDNPYFVGAHWFQYIDSPITGRAYDGENYNVGFVSVTDIPYAELVQAAKEIHRELYPRRYE